MISKWPSKQRVPPVGKENLKEMDPNKSGSSVPSVARGSWRELWSASSFIFPGMWTGTKEMLLWRQKNQLPCNSVQGKREKRTHSPQTNKASKLSERIWSIMSARTYWKNWKEYRIPSSFLTYMWVKNPRASSNLAPCENKTLHSNRSRSRP